MSPRQITELINTDRHNGTVKNTHKHGGAVVAIVHTYTHDTQVLQYQSVAVKSYKSFR